MCVCTYIYIYILLKYALTKKLNQNQNWIESSACELESSWQICIDTKIDL